MSQLPPTDIQTLHKSLTSQATTLLSELTAFHTYLDILLTSTAASTSASQPPLITRPDALLGKLEVDVRREVEHLLKYAGPVADVGSCRGDDGDDETLQGKGEEQAVGRDGGGGEVELDGIHRIRSSNITFLADVWEGVKRASGVVGVRKGVRYYPVPVRGRRSCLGSGDSGTMEEAAMVYRGAGGEAEEVNGTAKEKGIKGVSKKMNREARERAKWERKLQSQSHNHNHSEDPYRTQNPSTTDTEDSSNPHMNGNKTHKSPTHPTKTRGKLTTSATTNQPALSRKDKETITIDILSNHGSTWTKIFTKNTRWLIMDLAKEGIVDSPSSSPSPSDDESTQLNRTSRQEDEDKAMEELKLIKMAWEFMAAARTSRVGRGHRHPRVEFHLPKIGRGVSRDVDRVLGYLRRVGVEVVTMEELQGLRQSGHVTNENGERNGSGDENGDMKSGMKESERYERSLQEAFERMACPLPPVPVTETLNVDCTILIALTSDLSHTHQSGIIIPEHYKGAARRDLEVQLQTDVNDPLLPNHIYPILRGRRLVCTRKATEHWRNIVRVMGSPTEAERCEIFLGDATDDSQGLSARQRLQKLSVHEVPEDLQVPFEVVEFDLDGMSATTDDSACKQVEIDVMRELAKEPRMSSLNSSVFFHGWYKGLTTVSLNRVVSEWLTRAINVILDDLESRTGTTSDIAEVMGFSGANVLICGRERSLLGSEK